MDKNTLPNEEKYISPEMRIITFAHQSMILAGSNEGGESGDEHGWS